MPDTLRFYAEAAKLEIATDPMPFYFERDAAMRAVIGREFSTAIVGYPLNWNYIEATRGQFNFSRVESVLRFATLNRMQTFVSGLVFANVYPDWLRDSNFSRDELVQILTSHVRTTISRFKGRISRWIVTNESHERPFSRIDDVFLRVVGPEYVDIAFQAAREADPDATLLYNDVETKRPRADGPNSPGQRRRVSKARDLSTALASRCTSMEPGLRQGTI